MRASPRVRQKEATVSDPQTVPSDTLRLRPPRHRVERRAILWWTTQAALPVIFSIVGLALATWWVGSARFWFGLALIIVVVLGICHIAVMPQWRYRVHRYEVTDDAVYTAAGWINQEWRVAPLSRIQTVDTQRGPLQQLFRLSSVTVTTASAAGPLTIEGLDQHVATEVVEHLTAVTQATPGDAT